MRAVVAALAVAAAVQSSSAECKFEVNIDYSSGKQDQPPGWPKNVPSAAACCAACKEAEHQDPPCGAGVWSPPNPSGQCWFKSIEDLEHKTKPFGAKTSVACTLEDEDGNPLSPGLGPGALFAGFLAAALCAYLCGGVMLGVAQGRRPRDGLARLHPHDQLHREWIGLVIDGLSLVSGRRSQAYDAVPDDAEAAEGQGGGLLDRDGRAKEADALKTELARLGLSTQGSKAEQRERLQAAVMAGKRGASSGKKKRGKAGKGLGPAAALALFCCAVPAGAQSCLDGLCAANETDPSCCQGKYAPPSCYSNQSAACCRNDEHQTARVCSTEGTGGCCIGGRRASRMSFCCNATTTCCAGSYYMIPGTCCATNHKCCAGMGMCCPSDKTCCVSAMEDGADDFPIGTCCDAGSTCCASGTAAAGAAKGAVCCPSGTTCSNADPTSPPTCEQSRRPALPVLKTEDAAAPIRRSRTTTDWAELGGELVLSPRPHTYIKPQDLPAQFSWANKDGRSWLTLTRNQNMPTYCNSGWAHATTSSLADRVTIMQNASKPPMGPAPQVLLNCYRGGDCSGGDPGGIYVYAKGKM
eukprot:COSAG04_NODE_2836_length_3512_cov_1.423088_2_plen_581_part_00